MEADGDALHSVQSSPPLRSMTSLSHILRNAVLHLVEVPQRTLSKVTGRFSVPNEVAALASIPPPHVVSRLEDVFDGVSDLASQPSVLGALELACGVLQAELPTEALAAGLHDIDTDEIRFVVARGQGHQSLSGTAMPLARCVVGYAAEQATLARGGAGGVSWIGSSDAESTVLLCPIVHDANLLGLLALADPVCKAELDRYDLEVVRYVADQLAAFIHAHRQRPALAATSLEQDRAEP